MCIGRQSLVEPHGCALPVLVPLAFVFKLDLARVRPAICAISKFETTRTLVGRAGGALKNCGVFSVQDSTVKTGKSKIRTNEHTIHPKPNTMLSLLRPVSRLPLRRMPAARLFSSGTDDGSHPDFAAQPKTPPGTPDVAKMIEQHVTENPIMLYMKGFPNQPMCGFSSTVVNILKDESVDFSSVNVLDYPAIRDGVKKYSQWPTIPQLYVHGEFIGGCDIVTQMHESGELAELLKSEKMEEKKEDKPKQ